MISLKNVSFSYEIEKERKVLSDIDLEIDSGEVVLLCGESGCGKTTLSRLINGLIPHYYEGVMEGEVVVDKKNIKDTQLYDLSSTVGSVFQNPRSQFFSVDTTSELVFGCENQSMPKEEILDRMERVVKEFSMENLMGRSIFHLSGGEKQKIACAGVSMLSPNVVVLDEPTSNLDLEGIEMLKEALLRWKEKGKTIVIAEHRLWFLKKIADRVIYLKDGRIQERFDATDFFDRPVSFYKDRGLRSVKHESPHVQALSRESEAMVLEDVSYSYSKKKEVLSIPRMELPLGQVTAVVGKNGSGKSTFVQCMCGLLRQDKSILTLRGMKYNRKKRLNLCYPVMQDVNHQLFTESVLDEVLLSMEKEDKNEAMKYLKDMDLEAYQDVHPMALSGGQKQRLAIASALASQREILIFDEPTSGLDLKHMEQAANSISFLKKKGKTVIIVTHDTEFIARCCDACIRIENGHLEGEYGYK